MKRKSTLLLLGGCVLGLLASSCQGPAQPADTAPEAPVMLKDYGAEPTVLNIDDYTLTNDNFRLALWTGTHFQVTLMSIPVGGDIGLEQHLHTDQFLRIEAGQAKVLMGDSRDALTFSEKAEADFAIIIPAGKWHNVVNTGEEPLRIYSIYAPVEHPRGTANKTQQDAIEAEHAMDVETPRPADK